MRPLCRPSCTWAWPFRRFRRPVITALSTPGRLEGPPLNGEVITPAPRGSLRIRGSTLASATCSCSRHPTRKAPSGQDASLTGVVLTFRKDAPSIPSWAKAPELLWSLQCDSNRSHLKNSKCTTKDGINERALRGSRRPSNRRIRRAPVRGPPPGVSLCDDETDRRAPLAWVTSRSDEHLRSRSAPAIHRAASASPEIPTAAAARSRVYGTEDGELYSMAGSGSPHRRSRDRSSHPDAHSPRSLGLVRGTPLRA